MSDPKVSWGRLVQLDQLARLGPLVRPETPAQQVHRARLEMLDQWDPKALPVPLDPKARKAPRVPKGQPVPPALTAHPVPKVRKVRLVPKAILALQAHRASKDPKVRRERPARSTRSATCT